MSEVYKSAAEWEADERREKIIAYEDGTSAIVVEQNGEVVDLLNDHHKYLRHPKQNPSDAFISLEGTMPDGSKAEWLISSNNTVLIETNLEGEVRGSTGPTQKALLDDLIDQKLTIGEGVDTFGFAALDKVSAEYKTGNVPYADETRQGVSTFNMAHQLVEKQEAYDDEI